MGLARQVIRNTARRMIRAHAARRRPGHYRMTMKMALHRLGWPNVRMRTWRGSYVRKQEVGR